MLTPAPVGPAHAREQQNIGEFLEVRNGKRRPSNSNRRMRLSSYSFILQTPLSNVAVLSVRSPAHL